MHQATISSPAIDMAQLRPALDHILKLQNADGAIPWFEGGAWDAWNHVECAMALVVAGHIDEGARAYDYLLQIQREDGAWLGEYGNALPMVDRDFISREKAEALIDSNFCAYPAVGIAHYFEVTRDYQQLCQWWPMVKRALDFVLRLQRPDGTISWSLEAQGTELDDALLACNASIAKSLECGIFLAEQMHEPSADWRAARRFLMEALRSRPDLFDRRGTGARFAMDWYYPVLAGTLDKQSARERIDEKWTLFVDEDRGCRCVWDEPWFTTAESAELVMALLMIDDRQRARTVFDALLRYRDDAGVFWMGWQDEEAIIWPREQPSWTQAAVILAADALQNPCKGGNVLTRKAGLKPL